MIPQVELGDTGQKIPIFAIGTYGFKNREAMKSALIYAYENGIKHIDTAEMYSGAEEIVGEVIKQVGRENLFITTKVLPHNGSFKKVISACDRSLRKMGTDYVDLYLLHFYTAQYPLEETLSAFEHLVKEGKIRFYGVSNFELMEYDILSNFINKFKIQNNQVDYNVSNALYVEDKILPIYSRHKITISGYSPFWQGRTPSRRIVDVLESIARKYGKTVRQVILNFLTRTRNIFVIFKSENVEHIKENLGSLSFSLDEEDIKMILNLCKKR